MLSVFWGQLGGSDDCLAALSSRITRQLDPVAKIDVGYNDRVEVHDNLDAQAVATLLQAQEA